MGIRVLFFFSVLCYSSLKQSASYSTDLQMLTVKQVCLG